MIESPSVTLAAGARLLATGGGGGGGAKGIDIGALLDRGKRGSLDGELGAGGNGGCAGGAGGTGKVTATAGVPCFDMTAAAGGGGGGAQGQIWMRSRRGIVQDPAAIIAPTPRATTLPSN